MCTMNDCVQNQGSWVQFRTPWGYHRGIVENVTNQGVLMRVPRQYAPTGLVGGSISDSMPASERLDLALAGLGYGPYGRPGPYAAGRPGYPGYGYSRGYGGWWAGGWWLWWLAFASIFWLAFLW